MKITWFGGSTLRLYIGGKIIVTDADKAPDTLDAHEVSAAADQMMALGAGLRALKSLDVDHWKSKKPVRLIDQPEGQELDFYAIANEALFIDEREEGPVIVAPADFAGWGRFADQAIVVLYGDANAIVSSAQSLLTTARPRLLALGCEAISDQAFAILAADCRDCALQVLEKGFAVEA